MPVNLTDLLAALGAVPGARRHRAVSQSAGREARASRASLEVRDRELRIAGLGSMLVGVVILFLVR